MVQAAFASQPPFAVKQLFTGVQVRPSPSKCAWQAQWLVPGPVMVQAAFASQPPFAVKQLFTGVQVRPSPL
jgi:hypothetical protein